VRRVQRRVALTYAVAAAIAVTVIAPTAQADQRAEIQDLVDARARAILNLDRRGFAATLAAARPAFRREQMALFTRLAKVPFRSYRLRVRWDRLGDLARPSDRERYPAANGVVIPVTEERYRLAGYDRTAAVEDVFFTFVDGRDGWRIASDSDLDDVALYSARHPWDFHRLRSRESGHFLLLEPACSTCASAPAAALRLAESALQRVSRYWQQPWHKHIPVIVPNGTADLSRMLQLTFDVENFVAFAVSTVDLDNGVDYSGHRIVLNPDAFDNRTSDSTLDILAHEILHVATRKASGPFVPTWIEEGIAEYVGHEGSTLPLAFLFQDVTAGSFDGRLPEGFEFTIGNGVDIFRSYQKSYSAVSYFIGKWGLRSFVAFYRRLGRIEVAPGLPEFHVDRAMRDTIGVGLDQFERAWAGSIDSP
jgi:hypothetical protein